MISSDINQEAEEAAAPSIKNVLGGFSEGSGRVVAAAPWRDARG